MIMRLISFLVVAATQSTLFLHQSNEATAFVSVSPSKVVTVSIHHQNRSLIHSASSSSTTNSVTTNSDYLQSISQKLNDAISKCQPEFIKTCKVKVAPSPTTSRLGLIATETIKKGDVALAIPYDDQIILTPELTLRTWNGILPDGYDGWTGENGLLTMSILNELAKAASNGEYGIPLPVRKAEATNLMNAWVESLPNPQEMEFLHPILWKEDDQEILQSSTTKKIYRLLDDIDEDAKWLNERVWSLDRKTFPEKVSLNGIEYPCFTPEGFAWGMAIVSSRSFFVDGSVRIIPVIDMANHDDIGAEEVKGGFMGRFGTTKGAELRTSKLREYKINDEVFISYGPKSAAEYCLDHGFVPKKLRDMTTSVAELTFEIDPEDRFYDDKLDILEFETYDSSPMEPIQSFDLVSEIGRDGEPDPAMIQFLRLLKLGTKDAFLLESVFRKDIWGFMSLPVSEMNERDVLDTISSSCDKALEDMESVKNIEYDDSKDEFFPANICAIVRKSELKALTRTLDFVNREKEALDLKEYYQERRLKDLGLDSEWNPDESSNIYSDDEDDLGYGQVRKPGAVDW